MNIHPLMINRPPIIVMCNLSKEILALILLVFISNLSAASENEVLLKKTSSVLFVKWGSRDSEVAFRTQSDKDPKVVLEVPVAVNSFWVDNDETIYLLEAGRLLKVFRNGAFARSINIGKFGYVNDFSVIGDKIFVLTLHDLIELSKDGNLVRKRRVFGVAGPGRGVEKLIKINEKFVLKRGAYLVQEKGHVELSHACVEISTFGDASCGEFELALNSKQVLDSDGVWYVWNDTETNQLVVSPVFGCIRYDTGFDGFRLSEEIEFLYNSIVRIRESRIYVMSPESEGLRILSFEVPKPTVSGPGFAKPHS